MELVKISELARLSDVPTATIKYYLRAGLLPGPAKRTSRNMAYYDARLCHRVRVIKELQQARFLPLKVIATLLEPAPSSAIRADLDDIQRRQLGLAQPAAHDGIDAAGLAASPGARPDRRGRNIGRTREQILEDTRLTAEDLERLSELGLAEPVRSSAGALVYHDADLELLEAVQELRAHDMGELFPLDILETYAQAVRELVRVERELFKRRVLGGARLPDMDLADIARQANRVSERLFLVLRAKLMSRESSALAPASADDERG